MAAGADTPIPVPIAGLRIPPASIGRVGDFEVIDKLGQGGMGTVYRARQVSLDRVVALKVLPPHAIDDEDAVRRFQREAALAASLNHPNLVRVYAAGEADGSHYIAMEVVEGENLRQRLRRGPLSLEEAIRVCLDVARGLQCGWDRAQLIHRDIKPSNIYLSEKGEVKLGDLGIAKSLAENTTGLTQTGAAIGTALYMSPEQARGEKSIDFRADIYSLGFTLYECLTGQPGYAGTQPSALINQHLNAPVPGLLKVMPGCPMPVVRLFGKMVRKNRHERQGSYSELIAQMEGVLEQFQNPNTGTILAPTVIPTSPSASPGTTRSSAPALSAPTKSPTALYAGIAVLAVVVVAAGFAALRTKPASDRRTQVGAAGTPARATSPAADSASPRPASTPLTVDANRQDRATVWQSFGVAGTAAEQAGPPFPRDTRAMVLRRSWTVGDGDIKLQLRSPDLWSLNLRVSRNRVSMHYGQPGVGEIQLLWQTITHLEDGKDAMLELGWVEEKLVANIGGRMIGPVAAMAPRTEGMSYVGGDTRNDALSEFAVLDGTPESDWPAFVREGARRRIVAGAPPVAPPPGVNPSFEAPDRSGVPAGWSFRMWIGTAQTEVVTLPDAPNGQRVAHIRATADTGSNAGLTTYVKAKPYTRYRLTGWIKTRGVTGAIGAHITCHGTREKAPAAPFLAPPVTGDQAWTRVEKEFDSGKQNVLPITCAIGGWGASTGEAWFDDVRLSELE